MPEALASKRVWSLSADHVEVTRVPLGADSAMATGTGSDRCEWLAARLVLGMMLGRQPSTMRRQTMLYIERVRVVHV